MTPENPENEISSGSNIEITEIPSKGGASDVFDGPVSDVAPSPAPAADDAPKKTKGGARKGKLDAPETPKTGSDPSASTSPVEPPVSKEPTEEEVRRAEGLVRLANGMQCSGAAKRCALLALDATETKRYVDALKFSDSEISSMARPLAEGMKEYGVDMPWELRLAIAVGMVYYVRQKPVLDSLTQLEIEKAEKEKAPKANLAPSL